jgi:hypothetical protein
MRSHKHKCGLTILGQLKDYGCGHVWEHETTENWYMKDHYCPRCGKGPFTFLLEESLQEI